MSDELSLFTGAEITETFSRLGVTHVIWVPDSTTGTWEETLESAESLRLLRVCREGEAWPLAAGLLMGGAAPVVVIQTTGLFESGDALRNVVFDLKLPVFAIIGARNWLIEGSRDSAKMFTLPILQAWGIPYDLITTADDKPKLAQRYERAQRDNQASFAVLAEGRG